MAEVKYTFTIDTMGFPVNERGLPVVVPEKVHDMMNSVFGLPFAEVVSAAKDVKIEVVSGENDQDVILRPNTPAQGSNELPSP